VPGANPKPPAIQLNYDLITITVSKLAGAAIQPTWQDTGTSADLT